MNLLMQWWVLSSVASWKELMWPSHDVSTTGFRRNQFIIGIPEAMIFSICLALPKAFILWTCLIRKLAISQVSVLKSLKGKEREINPVKLTSKEKPRKRERFSTMNGFLF